MGTCYSAGQGNRGYRTFVGGSAIDLGSSHHYRSVLRLLPVPACIHSDGTIRYVNPAMVQLLGAGSAEHITGRRMLDLINGSGRARFETGISQVLNGDAVPPVRNRLLRAGGTAIEVEVASSLIHYNGRPAVLGVFTEHRRDSMPGLRARRRERRLSRIVEGAPAAIFCARPDGRVEYVNRQFLEFTGLRLQDAIRSGWLEAVHPEDRDRCREAWNECIANGSGFDAQYRVRGRDGRDRWFRGIAAPVRDGDGRIVRWCAVATDVEEIKRGEAALEINENRFRPLFEGNLVGLAIGNGQRVMEVNDLFLRIVGRTREEIERGDLVWEAVIPPEEDELGRRKLEEIFTRGECPAFETAFLRKDGSRVPVLVAGILLAREPEPRVMALMVDLTERRQLQEIRADKMKLETVSMLAAGMAHNLNNLLTAVIGNASLLLDQHIGPHNARGYTLVRDIISAGERAAALISKLLSCAGQGRYVVSATDAGTLIGSEIERLRATLPPNTALDLEVTEPLPSILIGPDPLRQIVEGLVTNAVEAIGTREGGGVRVGVRMEHLSPKAATERFPAERLSPGDYCMLDVQDNGSGMDPATLARIFDPFFTTKFTGRGLGLASIAGIVRAAHGAIRVWTTPGAGTLFRVYLPVSTPHE